MPPKRDKSRKGGAAGNGGGGGAGTASGRRTRNATAGSNGAAAHSKRVVTPKPEASTSGRSTYNSRGKRRVAAANRTPTPTVKRAKRGGARSGKKEKDLNSFKDENGEVYKAGDFAYVDSQQPDLPHHICVIRDFKLDRKDTVIAEVKWFYRVSELPESVYDLLMQDRDKGKDAEVFKQPRMRERELFMAFNIDTHSASLFRGKCKVKQFCEVGKMDSYLKEDNAFFYIFGYKPESRRLTLTNQDIYIPFSQQAELPECQLAPPSSPSSFSSSPRPLSPSDRYSRPEERITHHEELVWKPELADDQLLMYLRAARSIALHAGVCMNGLIADGFLAASADETTQHAFNTLHRNGHSTEKALQELVKRPTVGQLVNKRNWSKESSVLFAKGMRLFGKNFFKIQKELLPKKQIRELAEYYYYWKKTHPGLTSRNTRRQRKQMHIRLCRTMMKLREVTPEREFMDWSSCDEDEAEEDGEKVQSNVYACRNCYSRVSPNWHHAGQQKAILCVVCRIHYKKYGLMKPVDVPSEAPDILYKAHYESPSNDDTISVPISGSRRKTRNSNGSRGVASRPGLRSQKITNKSDSDDDDATDSSSEGSVEDESMRAPPKQKALQTRRSILDHLDDSTKTTPTGAEPGEQAPPAKRVKKGEEGNESDEEGSTGSTTGEGDRESTTSTQKSSSGGQKSPANSSMSSQTGGEKDESSSSSIIFQEAPSTSQVGSNSDAMNLPQNFSRVCKDQESTCARTDLVYVHPPPEEKPLSVPKLHPQVVQRLTGPLPPPSHTPSSATIAPPSTKVPIITNYAPQLPMGPGPILPFPFSYPQMPPPPAASTLPSVVSLHDAPHQRRSVETTRVEREREIKRERDEQQSAMATTALWQQQQWMQQKQQLEIAQAQAQAHAAHAQLATPHLMQGAVTQTPPISHAHPAVPPHSMDHHSTGPSQQQQQQQLAFTFPSPEEMAIHQRLMQLAQSGAVSEPFPGAAAILQPGVYPSGSLAARLHPGPAALTMEAFSHLRPEEQAILAAQAQAAHAQAQAAQAQGQVSQFIPGMVPTAMMEQLMVQQQQQQQQQQHHAMVNAVAAAAASGLAGPGVIPTLPENVLEMQRQYEALMQAVHKNPAMLQNPQVTLAIEQYQRAFSELAQFQQQQQRMHEAMLQNTQQEMLHKHLLLARVSGGPPDENSSSRGIRPGVIVQGPPMKIPPLTASDIVHPN